MLERSVVDPQTRSDKPTMSREAVFDELREVERQVIEGERRLAACEARVVELKRSKQDATAAEAELERMRKDQRVLEHDRQRLLRRLQP
ncbi:hypothetical protein [Bradyrhizobium yuanmingense]|uniref:hypothetical protein n=1 Tax=Bradyrhizobium yuanmingense TaxID=108015 RepID=UPI001FD0EA45|nr:hypothetical protein [Bradyrhizobium yuanmingense]